MTFRVMAIVMAVAGCLLGIRLLFAGGALLRQWGIEETAGSLLLLRRIGVMYLSLALMFYLGRAAGPSDIRSAVCLVAGGAIALLSCIGLYEFLAGRASTGILNSVVAEAVLAAGFIWVWWGGR